MKIEPKIRAFLLTPVHTAKIATVRDDGRPHVVPVWYDLDGDTIVFTTWHTTIKAHNIRRDPRICICVDDEQPPFSFLQIDGTAELINDMELLRHWAHRLGGRYMGADLARAYGLRNSVAGELVVRVTPTRFIFKENLASF